MPNYWTWVSSVWEVSTYNITLYILFCFVLNERNKTFFLIASISKHLFTSMYEKRSPIQDLV